MTDCLITHLRHVDLAIPDFERQRGFYTDVWGLTQVAGDTGLAFLAAEGSPERYIIRLRKDAKRLDRKADRDGDLDLTEYNRMLEKLANRP